MDNASTAVVGDVAVAGHNKSALVVGEVLEQRRVPEPRQLLPREPIQHLELALALALGVLRAA